MAVSVSFLEGWCLSGTPVGSCYHWWLTNLELALINYLFIWAVTVSTSLLCYALKWAGHNNNWYIFLLFHFVCQYIEEYLSCNPSFCHKLSLHIWCQNKNDCTIAVKSNGASIKAKCHIEQWKKASPETHNVHEARDLKSSEVWAPLKRRKIAADENIRSLWSDEDTIMFLKLTHETINVIFPSCFPHCYEVLSFHHVILLYYSLVFSNGVMVPHW